MAIDIRATVTCSLGTLISGSISDDYIQGSGLVKTKGSVEISGTITPAIGTVVTFSYVKGGVTRSIPRKLRVMSSFADPFRRTTKVELGCKLTYLSDLQEPVDWNAFDDPANTAYDEGDARIVTLPIYASSAMDKCLTELGITASSNPLTNKFSVATFDFGGGYVQVLNDLLVSESYCGYLDTSEVLQVFALDQDAGTGPVFTASDIVDLGPIGVGQLPGEAVTVSYSSLKLKQPETLTEEEEKKLNWEYEESIGIKNFITVSYRDIFAADPEETQYQTWIYIPRTVSVTNYDSWDRVTKRVTTEYTIGAAVNTQYFVDQHQANRAALTYIGFYEISEQENVNTEQFEYKMPAQGKRPETGSEEISRRILIREEPQMAVAGSIAASFIAEDGFMVDYMPLYGSTIVEESIETYETATRYIDSITVDVTKTILTQRLAYGYTQFGQQQLAREQAEGLTTTTTAIFNAMKLTPNGSEINIRQGRSVGVQIRPSSADLSNAAYSKGGDPNNGWRVESTASLELALGSATAQRRIEFSLPYAPDDIFSGPSGGPFTATPSDAPAKANRYGRVQNRLLLGNRSGINLQLAPEKLPAAPYSPLYVQANGLTAQYRANGTSWTFDSNGIVASVDALFWSAIGGTGTFWFPVAPGITTLPTTPAIVRGAMTPTTVVLPYNETAIYEGRLRLAAVVTTFDYALTLLTVVPVIATKVKVGAASIFKVEVPAASITMAAAVPAINTGAAVMCPAVNITVSTSIPSISV